MLGDVSGGSIGVFRGSIRDITDPTNEATAYAILGFAWGMGGGECRRRGISSKRVLNLIRRHTPVVGPVSSLIVCLLLQNTLIRDFFRSLVEYSKVLLSIIRIRQSANWVSEDQRLAVKCRSKHSTRL